MAEADFYIAVRFNGVLKKLASLHRAGDDTINVFGSKGPNIATATSLEEVIFQKHESFETLQNKYISVHSSHGDPNVNIINHNILRVGQSKTSDRLYSRGIKVDNEFIPLILKAVGRLDDDRHNLSDKCDFEIPECDPNKDTLIWMLAIGPRDRSFSWEIEHPSNLHQFIFGGKRIVFVWSLFNLPAIPHTVDFKTLSYDKGNPLEGLTNLDIYNQYTLCYSLFADAYFNAYPQGYKHDLMS